MTKTRLPKTMISLIAFGVVAAGPASPAFSNSDFHAASSLSAVCFRFDASFLQKSAGQPRVTKSAFSASGIYPEEALTPFIEARAFTLVANENETQCRSGSGILEVEARYPAMMADRRAFLYSARFCLDAESEHPAPWYIGGKGGVVCLRFSPEPSCAEGGLRMGLSWPGLDSDPFSYEAYEVGGGRNLCFADYAERQRRRDAGEDLPDEDDFYFLLGTADALVHPTSSGVVESEFYGGLSVTTEETYVLSSEGDVLLDDYSGDVSLTSLCRDYPPQYWNPPGWPPQEEWPP